MDEEEPDRPFLRRALSEASRHALDRALTQRALGDLRGQLRRRTAERVRELRESERPDLLLLAWWRHADHLGRGLGDNLVDHARAGEVDYVRRVIRAQPQQDEFLRRPADLADVTSSARAIAGLTVDQLAETAGVATDVVRQIERGRMPGRVGDAMRVLRTLGIHATALPSVD